MGMYAYVGTFLEEYWDGGVSEREERKKAKECVKLREESGWVGFGAILSCSKSLLFELGV